MRRTWIWAKRWKMIALVAQLNISAVGARKKILKVMCSSCCIIFRHEGMQICFIPIPVHHTHTCAHDYACKPSNAPVGTLSTPKSCDQNEHGAPITVSHKAVAKLSAFKSQDKRKKKSKREKTTGEGTDIIHAITTQIYSFSQRHAVQSCTRACKTYIVPMCLIAPQDGAKGNRRLAAHRYVAEQRRKRGAGGSWAVLRVLADMQACAHACSSRWRRKNERTPAQARTHSVSATNQVVASNGHTQAK